MSATVSDPTQMTMRDRGMVICGPGKNKLGCIIGLADRRYAAWDRHRKLGEYSTALEAERAVRRPPKGPNGPKSWEAKS